MKEREIKFKGYKNGLVWYSENYESIGLFFTDMERIKANIMQYIGRKDKDGKGKDIYEAYIVSYSSIDNTSIESGAIVIKTSKREGLIKWVECKCIVDSEFETLEDITAIPDLEVIGNKYETK